MWIDMQEDIYVVAKRLGRLERLLRELPQERKNLNYINDLMNLAHQNCYLKMLNGLEN